MQSFQYELKTKVYFGVDSTQQAMEQELSFVGKNVLLAYGGGSIKANGIYDEVVNMLRKAQKNIVEFSGIMPNPTYRKVQEGVQIVKEHHIDFILAVGGGSVIDCCKIISAQALLNEDIWEMEFEKKKYPSEFIPMGAIVTVSGTGSEMNNGAVITHEDKKMKSGLLGGYAKFCVLNPKYTLSVPLKQMISGAFDTLSHAMETYFGKNECVSDDISIAIMKNTIKNIRNLIQDPQNIHYRSELMWDSAMAENGILKIGKITDFQAHMIEHQVGAYTNCNHGQSLAVIHPILYKHIYCDGLNQFVRFAKEVWGIVSDDPKESAFKGIEALENFIKEIALPTHLSDMNIHLDDKTLKAIAYSTNIQIGCCKRLTHEDIYTILKECC